MPGIFSSRFSKSPLVRIPARDKITYTTLRDDMFVHENRFIFSGYESGN